tara:strand:- start:782 stop:2503 length:1722 start_codon:yes stop_codon:yes gene_type:complete
MDQLRRQIGDIDSQQARSLGIADSTLNGLIAERLLELQASEFGLLISDDLVRRKIRQEQAFQNKAGQFDSGLYKTMLANNGLSEETYVASLRRETQKNYLEGMLNAGVSVPTVFSEIIFSFVNETRNADFIEVKRATLASAPSPSKMDLKNYYEKHWKQFLAPELRNVSILYLDPSTISKELSPSEEKIKEEYQNQLASLTIPESRKLQQILVKKKEVARSVHSALTNGQSFKTVAKNTLGKLTTELDLGFLTRDDMLPNLADEAFSTEIGFFTKPIKSPLGWHVIKVEEIQAGRQPKLEEVHKKLSNEIAYEMALDDVVKRAERIEDALAGGASIETVGQDVRIKLLKTGLIDSSGRDRTGNPVNFLPSDPKFIQSAFTSKKGETSSLVETKAGGYFVLRVDEIKKPTKRPLPEVSKKLVEKWQILKLDDAAKKTANELKSKIDKGVKIEKVARSKNLRIENTGTFTRFSVGKKGSTPQSLVGPIFELNLGKSATVATPDGYAVAILKKIILPNKTARKSEIEELTKTLKAELALNIFKTYTKALREEFPVKINKTSLDTFFKARTSDLKTR